MNKQKITVAIVEDEFTLSQLYSDFIQNFEGLELIGIANTYQNAEKIISERVPELVLIDNYLPDGQGIDLFTNQLIQGEKTSAIFITAASEMEICSKAISYGAFDYILKPISWKRLTQSLERFIQFKQTQQFYKIIDQKHVDNLFQLKSKNFTHRNEKGIEESTLNIIFSIFENNKKDEYTIDDIVEQTGLSKTTARRYLEYCVKQSLISVKMQYGKVGHPRRIYLKSR
ncbi:response regulator [Celerinatantimonas yamalensis]|uniref:Transcriptional regulatory protein n=1 Tax=Celerinatantimonas yamalensis TaxID=559956 RepID=A0ABW9GBG1_9GAMM